MFIVIKVIQTVPLLNYGSLLVSLRSNGSTVPSILIVNVIFRSLYPFRKNPLSPMNRRSRGLQR
jgi:hypothetical protein